MLNNIIAWLIGRYIKLIDCRNKLIIIKLPLGDSCAVERMALANIDVPKESLGVIFLYKDVQWKTLNDTELMELGLKRIDFHTKKEI